MGELFTSDQLRKSRGREQVARFWRAEDGDLDAFVEAHFVTGAALDALFERMELVFESLDGHFTEIARDLGRQVDLDLGRIQPVDELLYAWSPAAHLNDDLFQNKLAFVLLQNFPLTTLEERLAHGERWTRRQWAEARLAQRFSKRVPAEVNAAIAQASAETGQYVAEYNIWMRHVVGTGDPLELVKVKHAGQDLAPAKRLFPAKMRLLSHWNLRDEIKALYREGDVGKQRRIQGLLEHVVDDTLRPGRYELILGCFRAARRVDQHSPTAPTLIERRFNEDRELPEPRVRAMLEQVLASPLVPRVARLVEQRLGRALEPFDIWFNGFRSELPYDDARLSEITRTRYPNAAAFEADLPRIFAQLGFAPDRARMLAGNIVVDAARGSGHAMGAGRRADHPHLRTRVGADGMDYKGYNIAIHELGHNVEQTFSLNFIDHTSLAGVPNTAFTEALAFVFQKRDLELLGLAQPESSALNDFWATVEIAGVALVDMETWHWMYAHPSATADELREAVLDIAKSIWNRWYAPHFGARDVTLLACYAHMVDELLYLPDYPIGHMIAAQIEQQIEKAGNVGAEFERMATMGNVTPDLWMRNATGEAVGPEALLRAAARELA